MIIEKHAIDNFRGLEVYQINDDFSYTYCEWSDTWS